MFEGGESCKNFEELTCAIRTPCSSASMKQLIGPYARNEARSLGYSSCSTNLNERSVVVVRRFRHGRRREGRVRPAAGDSNLYTLSQVAERRVSA